MPGTPHNSAVKHIKLHASGVVKLPETDSRVIFKCNNPDAKPIQDAIGDGWAIWTEIVSLSGNRTFQVKHFEQVVSVENLLKCLSLQNFTTALNSTTEETLIGYLNITGFENVTNTMQYYVPCKFTLDNNGCGSTTVQYGVNMADMAVRTLQVMWIQREEDYNNTKIVELAHVDNQIVNPSDSVNIIEVCTERPASGHVRLINSRINSTTSRFSPEYQIVSLTGCIQNHPRNHDSCCQIVTLVSVGGSNFSVFDSYVALEMDIEYADPGHYSDSDYVMHNSSRRHDINNDPYPMALINIYIYMNKPENRDITISINTGYNLGVELYSDSNHTVPSSQFVDGQRVYARLEIEGVNDYYCEMLNLDIQYARVCVSNNQATQEISSCSDADADIYTILDRRGHMEYYGGNTWRTRLESVAQFPTHKCKLSMSWIARAIGSASRSVIVEAEWLFDHQVGVSSFDLSPPPSNWPTVTQSLWNSNMLYEASSKINSVRRKLIESLEHGNVLRQVNRKKSGYAKFSKLHDFGNAQFVHYYTLNRTLFITCPPAHIYDPTTHTCIGAPAVPPVVVIPPHHHHDAAWEIATFILSKIFLLLFFMILFGYHCVEYRSVGVRDHMDHWHEHYHGEHRDQEENGSESVEAESMGESSSVHLGKRADTRQKKVAVIQAYE